LDAVTKEQAEAAKSRSESNTGTLEPVLDVVKKKQAEAAKKSKGKLPWV
jgi:hypothetical protein